jgi:hypothetical protein
MPGLFVRTRPLFLFGFDFEPIDIPADDGRGLSSTVSGACTSTVMRMIDRRAGTS